MLRALLLGGLVVSLGAASDTGKELFERHCALCHGIGGTGGRGPALTRPKLIHAADDAALKNVILEGIEPEMPAVWFLEEPAVTTLVAYVRDLGKLPPEKLSGNPENGAAVYRAQGCAACHTLAGAGIPYGPDLSDIGSRRSASYLEESLLRPAAALPEGFLWMRVRTTAGQQVEGVRVAETTFTLYVRDARGTLHRFAASDIAGLDRLTAKSPMPAYQSLSATDRADLVAFLATRKGNP